MIKLTKKIIELLSYQEWAIVVFIITLDQNPSNKEHFSSEKQIFLTSSDILTLAMEQYKKIT